MCGIAGIFDWSGQAVHEAQLHKMTDAIQHRGPDAAGFFVSQHVGLGHRRLAIIDLSAAANQPMCIDNLVLVYNGEIYNYIELRAELEVLGYEFSTTSDAEVLLRSYQHWGAACLTRFNGMWAFAIYNTTTQRLFCSRDRFGVKPFYYTVFNNQFVFCSELKGILAYTKTAKSNQDRLLQYLVANVSEHPTATFFDSIYKIPAGHYLVTGPNAKVDIQPYYHVSFQNNVNQQDEQESIHELNKRLDQSIVYRLRSDVAVGTCLSGGLDSSTIAAKAAALTANTTNTTFKAVTALSVDESINEAPFARQIVEQHQLDWITTKPSTADFNQVLNDVVYTQEEPFDSPSVCMQYFVMKAAHDAGIKVLLDGQGADEVLLGYTHYAFTAAQHLDWQKRPFFLLQCWFNSGLPIMQFLKNYLFVAFPKLRLRQQLKRWPGLQQVYLKRFQNKPTHTNSLFDFQQQELLLNSLPALLRYEDKNSMRFSIETRLPFLDWQLVESMLNVNGHLKYTNGWSKYLLRKAAASLLPESIVWRKRKLGFVAPEKIWLQDWTPFEAEIQQSKILQQLFQHQIPFQQTDAKGKWRLLCIAKWEKTFGVSV